MVVYLEHDRVGHHMDFQRCLLYDANGDVLDTFVLTLKLGNFCDRVGVCQIADCG